MKAAIITRFGAPGVLEFREIPRPEPGEGEITVRTKAVGLNFADVFARLGVYPGIPTPPFIPGIEFSGVVQSVGSGVQSVRRGDRVFGFSRQGAYAEFVRTRADSVMKIPARMSFLEAAALPVASLSAYHGLITLGNIARGEKLLLHAAAGGVGTMAIQIARHLGAIVFGTAGSPEKLEAARKLGAEYVINYRNEDFEEIVRRETKGYGVDIVLDSVGGSVFRKGWKLLAPMGRYVLYGFASVTGGRTINKARVMKESAAMGMIFPPNMVSRNVSLMGFNLYFLSHKSEYLRGAMKQLLKWHQRRIIRPVVETVFSFDNIVSAHEFLQARKSIGKVVVEV